MPIICVWRHSNFQTRPKRSKIPNSWTVDEILKFKIVFPLKTPRKQVLSLSDWNRSYSLYTREAILKKEINPLAIYHQSPQIHDEINVYARFSVAEYQLSDILWVVM